MITSGTISAACNPSLPAQPRTDSGMFETNLHDERYLPFENSGVATKWQLELPANPSNYDPRQFEYATISDAILHIPIPRGRARAAAQRRSEESKRGR